jgi:uncharacterized protein (DUF3084 family)
LDLVPILFLALVVVIGAVIALFADWLGRTVGKKRLKFLHLRPRHTAAFFTAMAGLLIPLVTVLVVAAVSSDVRQWILEGRKALSDVVSLQGSVQRLRSENDELEKRRLKADQDYQRSIRDYKSSITKLDSQLKNLGDDVSAARLQVSAARIQVQATKQALDRARGELNNKNLTLEERARKLSAVSSSLAAAAEQLEDFDIRVRQFEQELSTQQQTIDSLNKTKGQLEADIASTRIQYQQELAANDAELKKVQSELAQVRNDLASGQKELEDLRKDLLSTSSANFSSRSQPMIYAMGHEVARLSIEANLRTSQARNDLNRLLRSARIIAEQRGAAGSRPAFLMGQNVDGVAISPEQVGDAIVATIAGRPEPLVLVARSVFNSFRGEAVGLTIDVYPDKKAFDRGELVAETRVDGQDKPSDILSQITAFLAGPLREKAMARGMIPIDGQEGGLGTLTPGDVLNLVSDIRAQGRVVRVQVIADEEIRASEPLRISFRIK